MVKVVDIFSFIFDDENEEKIHSHGLTVVQVDKVLGNEHIIVKNRKGRRSPILVIGKDDGGRCITIAAEPISIRGIWRPVTAWSCKDHENANLRRRTGG